MDLNWLIEVQILYQEFHQKVLSRLLFFVFFLIPLSFSKLNSNLNSKLKQKKVEIFSLKNLTPHSSDKPIHSFNLELFQKFISGKTTIHSRTFTKLPIGEGRSMFTQKLQFPKTNYFHSKFDYHSLSRQHLFPIFILFGKTKI